MKAARLDTSPRLQRVYECLLDGGWHSTRDIVRRADVCAVNSCVAELRDPRSGFEIETRRKNKNWEYRLVQQRAAA